MIKRLYLGQSSENTEINIPLGNILINGHQLYSDSAELIVKNVASNIFSKEYPNSCLIFHGFTSKSHDVLINYNNSISVGDQTVSYKYSQFKFYDDLYCEYLFRKKYNKSKSPIIVSILNPDKNAFWLNNEIPLMIRDSFLYNIFFVCLHFGDKLENKDLFQHKFKIETDVLLINNEALYPNKFESLNKPKILTNSSKEKEFESLVFPSFTKNPNNNFGLPKLHRPNYNLFDLEDLAILVSNNIINYKEITIVNSSSKEECLLLLNNKRKLNNII